MNIFRKISNYFKNRKDRRDKKLYIQEQIIQGYSIVSLSMSNDILLEISRLMAVADCAGSIEALGSIHEANKLRDIAAGRIVIFTQKFLGYKENNITFN